MQSYTACRACNSFKVASHNRNPGHPRPPLRFLVTLALTHKRPPHSNCPSCSLPQEGDDCCNSGLLGRGQAIMLLLHTGSCCLACHRASCGRRGAMGPPRPWCSTHICTGQVSFIACKAPGIGLHPICWRQEQGKRNPLPEGIPPHRSNLPQVPSDIDIDRGMHKAFTSSMQVHSPAACKCPPGHQLRCPPRYCRPDAG